MLDAERTPPHNKDAERAALGCMLVDATTIPLVLSIADPADFFVVPHAALAEALSTFHADPRGDLDLVTFRDRLREHGILKTLGGEDFLARLAECVPSTANAEHYAKIVRDHATRRRAIDTLNDNMLALWSPEGATQDVLDSTMTAMRDHLVAIATDNGLSPEEALDFAQAAALRDKEGHSVIIPVNSVDDHIGPLQCGWNVVIGGLTSSGKTSLALQIAWSALASGIPTRIQSVEMTAGEIAVRMLTQQMGQMLRATTDGSILVPGPRGVEYQALRTRYCAMPLVIDPAKNITLAEIQARCERQKRRSGLGLVVIDYLQLLRVKHTSEGRTRELENLSRDCKILAGELGVVLIVLTQLNRAASDSSRPRMSHIKGSSSIEQDADVVMIVDFDRGSGEGTIFIDKFRGGRTGDVPVRFDGAGVRFVDSGAG